MTTEPLTLSDPMTTKTATRNRKTSKKTAAAKSSAKNSSTKSSGKAASKTAGRTKSSSSKSSAKSSAGKSNAKKSAKKTASSTASKTSSKGKMTTKPVATTSTKSSGKLTTKATTRGTSKSRAKKSATPERLSAAERKRAEQARIDQIWKTFKRTGDLNLRNILVEYHFPLVRYIAERLLQTLPKSIDLDDLVSAGTFGLLDAIRGFDLKRGIKFKTYCSTRIRGSILDELRSQDWVPRLVRLKAHKLDKAVSRLEAQHGREINDYELAKDLEITMEELAHLKVEASPKTMFSLSEKLDESDDDRDMEKVEIIEDKKGCDPVQSLHQQDVLDVITSNLTKKERLIVIMYYYEGLTMREIGDIMSLTESRVCQIHSNVMGRLKTQLDAISN